jgi:hypothetical protein
MLKDSQHAAKEIELNAKLKELELCNLLQIAMEKNYAMNPRIFLIFVAISPHASEERDVQQTPILVSG